MAVAARTFLDTSVLLAGLVELGETSAPAERVLDGVSSGRVKNPCTAWHCCLEFYSVATRLPAGLRLEPATAWALLDDQIFGRFGICDLPESARTEFMRSAARGGIAGGRIYDAHIAESARLAGATIVVTDNPRHFAPLARYAIQVVSALEFADGHGL